jgi:N-methylhydantoinase A
MRYHGQGHEIEILLPDRDLAGTDIDELRVAFEAEYSRQFSRSVPGMTIEILNWAVTVSTHTKLARQNAIVPKPKQSKDETNRKIICDISGKQIEAHVYDRESLNEGSTLSGPALIVEPQTTTYVSADFSAAVDGIGNLVLTRIEKEGASP